MFSMFTKRPSKNYKEDIGELLANYKPIQLWTKAKSLTVADLSNGYDHYENVEFRVLNNTELIIRDREHCIVYNLEQIIKYIFVEDDFLK